MKLLSIARGWLLGTAGLFVLLAWCGVNGGALALAAEPAPVPPPTLQAPAAQTAQVTARPAVRNVAIFVKNRAGKALDDKVQVLEDLVASRVADAGFSVISRENTVNSVAAFAGQGANVGKADGPGAELDAILSNQTSALRLAQNMGADYIFDVSIATLGQSKKAFAGDGIETLILEAKLRVSYKILDKFIGGTLGGDTVVVSKSVRIAQNSAEQPDVVNDLLDEAAIKLVASIQDKIEKNKIREVAGDAAQVSLTVVCGIQGMVVPDVVKNDQGEYVLTQTQCKLEAMNVTVELNGIAIGTAPGTFKVAKGLSKIRLTREGCKDWERTISPTEGQKLNVDLQLSDQGYARWKDTTAFLANLKAGAKLTDAQVKVLEGFAQELRQSGYKVDYKADVKEDVKVNTTEGLKIQKNQAREISVWQ